MDLTVIINCYDDPHIFTCIDSIDEDVEVLVVIADSKNIRLELERRKIRYVKTVPGNYSKNCNLGIAHANHNLILIMDSDCSFAAGCLKRIHESLKENEIVKCRIEFLSDEKIFLSNVIACLRDSVNNRPPIKAYTPGLGIRRSIASRIGGYFFDEDVRWAADSELNRRIMAAGLHIEYNHNAIIYHQPISIIYEMKSGYLKGGGERTKVEKGYRPNYESPIMILKKLLSGYTYRHYKNIKKLCGWQGFFLMLCWDIAFYAGSYFKLFQRK